MVYFLNKFFLLILETISEMLVYRIIWSSGATVAAVDWLKVSNEFLKSHLKTGGWLSVCLGRLLGEDETTREITFEPKSNVILVDGLTERITTMMEEESIKNEYNSVPKLKLHSWSYARLPEHKTKNRYGNLLPYDHSRVVLKKDSPTDSDYINANFIDGFRKTNRYIAMQGPIDATINDFWRCVWQFKCHQIVVLTNLEENGKVRHQPASTIDFISFHRASATNTGRISASTMAKSKWFYKKPNCLPITLFVTFWSKRFAKPQCSWSSLFF